MLFFPLSYFNKKRHTAWLYRTVFHGRISALLVVFLLSSFAIQPFHKAMAMEDVSPAEEEITPVADDVRVQSVDEVESVVDEASPVAEESVNEEMAEPANETTDNATTSSDEISESTDEVVDETATTSEEVTEESIEENPVTDTEESEDAVEEEEAEVEESQATSTPVEGQVVEVQYLVTEENFYQFSKNACVAVGDGTYHCSKAAEDEADTNSVVFAEQGESGNMEIFLKTSRGKNKQITNNAFDDTAPHYDPESMRIVWQRLVDGRYQVILYDIMAEEETQLTFSRTNNMEPKVSDSGIVWQAWDNNDWEIMYFDGAYTDQITDNNAQDVAPVVQDRYVLWSVLGLEEQTARVYSLDTKETVSIQGHEGGSIINPRFVLVYDTEFDNGDTITKSFDPATGLSELVAAKPAPEPIDIPETDPTGEIRALLIQGKAQKDDKELEDVGVDNGHASSTATSSDPGTLNLKADDDGYVAPVVIPETETFVLTEYDLVIPSVDLFSDQ